MQHSVPGAASDSSLSSEESEASEDEVHNADNDEDEFSCDTKMEADLSSWVHQLGGSSAADALSTALSRVKAEDDGTTPAALADASLVVKPRVTMFGVIESSLPIDVLQAQLLQLSCVTRNQDEVAHLASRALGTRRTVGLSRLTPRAACSATVQCASPFRSLALTRGFGELCLLRSYAATDRISTLVISFAGNVPDGMEAAGTHDFVGVCKRAGASALFIRGNTQSISQSLDPPPAAISAACHVHTLPSSCGDRAVLPAGERELK